MLSAGSATIQISVDHGSPLAAWPNVAGYLPPDDRPMVTALVINNGDKTICLVSVDCCLVYNGAIISQPQNVEEIRNKVNSAKFSESELIICASHNHSGPDEGNSRNFVNATVQAIEIALKRMEPAEIGFGWRDSLKPTFNRVIRSAPGIGHLEKWAYNTIEFGISELSALKIYRNEHPLDLVDDEVSVLLVRAPSGRAIATLYNYSCHAVTYGPKAGVSTADYPGVVRRTIKERLGGEVLFLQGAAGDVDPWSALAVNLTHGRNLALALGCAISDEIIEIINEIIYFDRNPELSSAKRRIEPVWPNNKWPSEVGEYKVQYADIYAARIGEKLVLGAFPGELFTSFGIELKNEFRKSGREAIICDYANDSIGYIPDIIPDSTRDRPVSNDLQAPTHYRLTPATGGLVPNGFGRVLTNELKILMASI